MQPTVSYNIYPVDGFLFLLGDYDLSLGSFLLAIVFLIKFAFLPK
jgi:hypothetical protein